MKGVPDQGKGIMKGEEASPQPLRRRGVRMPLGRGLDEKQQSGIY
jgi:hypothetical protein